MPGEEQKQSRETFSASRRKADLLILSQLSDEDVLLKITRIASANDSATLPARSAETGQGV